MSRWIAVDWLLSAPRAWVVEGAVTREIAPASPAAPDADPEAALLLLLDAHLGEGKLPILCCGPSRGWNVAPLRSVPAAATGPGAPGQARDPHIAIRFLPGLAQSDPPDAMQGEETRIAGFVGAHPDCDGVLCLPGARTVWAHISAGEVVSFRTYLTAELAVLISEGSTLGPVLAAQASWDEGAFLAALSDAMSRPERVPGALSSLRVDPAHADARLWGMLIGQELAATRAYWLGQRVALIGARTDTARYAAALAAQGVIAQTADGADMALAGLISAHAQNFT